MRTIVTVADDGDMRRLNGYTLREAAEQLGMHPDNVGKRVRAGLYPHVYVGRRIYFTEDQLKRIILARTREYPAHEPGGPR